MNNYLMIPSKTVKSDLVTSNKYLVYVPLATKDTYGVVKLGEGFIIDNGKISVDDSKLILEILKNGIKLIPDENKRVNIVLSKSDVGLSDVDNTSDLHKPVSILQQIELDKKLDKNQGADNKGKFLYITDDGSIGLITSSSGSIYTKYKNSLLSENTQGYNFTEAFALSVDGNEINIDVSNDFKSAFKDVSYNSSNGVLTFTTTDGKTKTVDLPLELLIKTGHYDAIARELVLVLANNDEIRIPVGNLVDQYFADEQTLTLANINGKLTFSIKEGVLDDFVSLTGTQILDAKVFKDEIAILNSGNNTIDRIKHINNNFLISSSDGTSLLNIDAQLGTISVFNKQLAFKDDVTSGTIDPATNSTLGSMRGNYNSTDHDNPDDNAATVMLDVSNGVVNDIHYLVDNGKGLIYMNIPEIYSFFKTSIGEVDLILDAINGEVI